MGDMKSTHILPGTPLYPFAVLIVTLILFSIHFFLGGERFYRRRIHPHLPVRNGIGAQALGVYYKRSTAFLLYVVCTLLVIRYLFHDRVGDYGLSRSHGKLPLLFIGPIIIITVLTMLFFSRREKIYHRYPEMEGARISRVYFVGSALSYVVYLFSYECLFRGFLLFGLKGTLGGLPSTLISMTFVTLSHVGTSAPVLMGAMASGLLFPYIALQSGSIWPVFALHSFIGIGMDFLCARQHTKVETVHLTVSREKMV
jgi:membrane protease YdiL (CAAX protease family)